MDTRQPHHSEPIHVDATHASLLSRVRDPANAAAWRQFEQRYREMLVRFCRGRGLQMADAEDVVQVVMTSLAKSLPNFAYDPARGRFRDYLYRCTRNAISLWSQRPNVAGRALDTHVEETSGATDSAAENAWEQEWIAHHYRLAITTIHATFEPRSVVLFERSLAGATVAELARDLEMSEQAVHKVRQRIKARMEELIAQQIKEEDQPDDPIRAQQLP